MPLVHRDAFPASTVRVCGVLLLLECERLLGEGITGVLSI